MECVHVSENRIKYVSESNELEIWTPVSSVVVVHAVGIYTIEFQNEVHTTIERAISSEGGIYIFYDFWNCRSYDQMARVNATEWFKKLHPNILHVNVLRNSKMMAMGFTLLDLAIPGLFTGHTEIQSYQAALADTLERIRSSKGHSGSG